MAVPKCDLEFRELCLVPTNQVLWPFTTCLKSELISLPHPLQQLYKENYLPTEYPGWSKCFYRYYLVRRKCQNTCEWIIRAYFHEESFTYTYNFHENPYFAPESINYVHFWFIELIRGYIHTTFRPNFRKRPRIWHFQTSNKKL